MTERPTQQQLDALADAQGHPHELRHDLFGGRVHPYTILQADPKDALSPAPGYATIEEQTSMAARFFDATSEKGKTFAKITAARFFEREKWTDDRKAKYRFLCDRYAIRARQAFEVDARRASGPFYGKSAPTPKGTAGAALGAVLGSAGGET